MNIIIKTGFQNITHEIKFQPASMDKGAKLVNANHVRNVQERRVNGISHLITAEVIRQMSVTETPYKTSLSVNDQRHVTSAACTCVYGKSCKCKHIAALIYYINNYDSSTKTSHEQEWGKPSCKQFVKDKYSKGQYFHEMFPRKQRKCYNCDKTKSNTNKICGPVPVDKSEFKSISAFKLMLMVADEDPSIHRNKSIFKGVMQELLCKFRKDNCKVCVLNFFNFQDDYPVYKKNLVLDENLLAFYNKNILLDEQNIIDLCCETIEQSNCDVWHSARRVRISSSRNVHAIKTRQRKTISNLVTEMLNPKKLKNDSLLYGIKHEPVARKAYEAMKDCDVQQVGVLVSKHQPWLCASIDGVKVEDGCLERLLEIKCPVTCKNKNIVDYEKSTCNVPYLYFDENNNVQLKQSEQYYTQIQIQLYICGLFVCDLFVFTPKLNGSIIVEVHRNDEFLKDVISICEHFYFKFYLPALFKANTSQKLRNFSGNDVSNTLQAAK